METQLHTNQPITNLKLKLLIFSLCCLFISPASALINTFSFQPHTQTIDPMSSSTSLIAAGIDDGASVVTNIGFTFNLNGVNYTQFSVNSNGLMRLGATVVSTSATNDLALNANLPKLSAYWDNLRTTTTTGSVRYRVSGIAPNRILIVDWNCTVVTSAQAVKFQVWLYETSNNIEFVYGACGTNTTNYSVGISTLSNATDYIAVTVASTFTSSTMAYGVINNSNTNTIANTTPNNSFRFSSVAPGCATLTPVDLINDIPTSQVLSWTAGSGVSTGYNVYFGTSATPPLVSTNQAGTSYNPGALSINTTYYWQVIPRNNAMLNSSCPVQQFTTVAPPECASSVNPTDLSTGVSLLPSLTWAPGNGTTTGYDLYFGTNSNPPLIIANHIETFYDTSILNSNTVYFWKVVPRNSNALATGCPVTQFTTAVAPGCATNYTPATLTTNVPVNPTLTWSAGSGTTTGYVVYFGTNSNPPMVSSDQLAASYSPSTLNHSSTYYWKIIPQNLGAFSSGCPVNQFSTAIPPGCTTSPSPAASATNVNPTTSLSWTAGAGTTTGYHVYLGTSQTLVNNSDPSVRVSTNQPTTNFTPISTLASGATYYWKVIPLNADAFPSCTSNQFSTSVAPGCSTTPSPAASATNVATSATLSWSPGSGTINGYDVYFGQTSNPPKVSANQPGTTYNPGTLSASTTYYWKVVPLNNGAAPTSCSVNSFSTVFGTSCAINISPAHLSANRPLENTLSWSAGPGNPPNGYDVYFGTATSPPLVSSNQAGTTYSPGFLDFNTTYYWQVIPRTGGTPATGCAKYQFTTGSPIAYEITRNTGISYNSISGSGTSVAQASWRNTANTDDNLSSTIPIGFNFNYSGNTYSGFLVSTNGYITLNTGTGAIGNTTSPYGYDNIILSAAIPNTSPLLIAPLFDDWVCQGNSGLISSLNSSVKYTTTGSVGNRILTVEWIGLEVFGKEGPNLNFQVKLYEGSNNIDFVYGAMESFNGTFDHVYSYSVGMTGAFISTTPRKGEVMNQLTADTRNFDSTMSTQLLMAPACYTEIHFTPGNYTPYVPPVSLVPVNDNPAGAIQLVVNPSPCASPCGNYYSSMHATATASIPVCGVGASTPDDDVWFKFTAVNPNTTIKVLGGGNYDAVLQLLSNSLTTISCSNTTTAPPGLLGLSETITTSTLSVGSQYYVRVYHKGSNWGGSGSVGQFAICVSAVQPPPPNDECANAISLPSNSSFINGESTVAATASAGIIACNQPNTNSDDDVWYKFVANRTLEVVTVNAGSGFNAVIQLFSGNCGSLNSIGCSNNFGNGQAESLTASGLTIGATYYVRIFHAGIGGGTGSYTINFASPPPPCTALMLPPAGTTFIPTEGYELYWEGVVGADNYIVLLDTVNPPVHQFIQTFDTIVFTGQLVAGKTYYWKVIPGNGTSYTTSCAVSDFATEERPIALKVRAFMEGLYIGGGQMKTLFSPGDTLADSVTVHLWDVIADEELYSEVTRVSIHGWITAHFPEQSLDSDYYIVVTNKGSLQIWSPFYHISATDQFYDFTTAASQAYGSNMVQVSPGIWAMYYGDFNEDGTINYLDLDMVGAEAAIFKTGSSREDWNNDQQVESVDYSQFENRATLNLTREWPWHP